MKNQNYNVYTIYLKNNNQQILKHFEKDFEAREFVRKCVEKNLKEFFHTSDYDFSMLENYLEKRIYSYKISNDDFDCDEYAKQITPRVFDMITQNCINKGFKLVTQKEEQNLLKEIENCKIIQIKQMEKFIKIIYQKDEKIKYLTIEQVYSISSMAGFRTFFSFDNKKIEDEKKVIFLEDIKSIVKIFHLIEEEPYYRNDLIEIIYKDENNTTCSYRLTFEEEFDDIVVTTKKYENIFKFKSKVLDDENKTEFNFSYDDEYFYPSIKKDTKYKDGTHYRATYGDYPDYSCITYGKKVLFEFDENHLKGYNLGFLHDKILDKKLYDRLSEDEKDRFHRFLSIAELYINSLEINQKFDNEITFDWEKEPENYDNLEKINEFLNNNFEKELVYNNAEQGHPSTKDVYIYTKDDKKLFYFSEIKYYGDYKIVTLKYNNDLKEVIKFVRKNNLGYINKKLKY